MTVSVRVTPWGPLSDPATEDWLCTCTIITGDPNELVAQVHTRNASHPG